MNIKITAMCWIKGKTDAHETIELDDDQIMDVLRGAAPAVFRTPPKDQHHWELREVTFS